MARNFFCHASEDKPQVREVSQQLQALGFEPWLDEADILPPHPRRVEVAPPHAAPETVCESPPAPRLIDDLSMELILIPAGDFVMGSPDADHSAYENERPVHQVTISEPFYLGKYPVTQGQWEAVMGYNPSRYTGETLPVENVSWTDIQAFLQTLNAREGGRLYRLPSEAEWEYACRAGSSGLYCFGDAVSQLGDYAWYWDNSDATTHPVGEKRPNAWGLYDMHGNVWEWVLDWYGDYTAEAVTDPQGPATGADRVIRGGGWYSTARYARSAYRYGFPSGYQLPELGFRCAMAVPSK